MLFARADAEEVEACVLYEPYLERFARERERLETMARFAPPERLDYAAVLGLNNKARASLGKRRPRTLGEARSLPGVTPADLSVLMVVVGRSSRR